MDLGEPQQCTRWKVAVFGFQIGGEATDLILLVMNDRGMESILSSKVKLGADASVAAGPKGRDASADTDAWMRAEILSYSRSRGLFAGVSLEGTTLRPDDDASEQVYGHAIKAKEIVRGEHMVVPATGRHLVDVLREERTPQRIGASIRISSWELPACRDIFLPASYPSSENHFIVTRHATRRPAEKQRHSDRSAGAFLALSLEGCRRAVEGSASPALSLRPAPAPTRSACALR